MILRSNMRAAALAAVVLALSATVVSAGRERVRTVKSLRAQLLNLQIAATRTAIRAQVSQAELKTKTPLAQQFYAVSSRVGIAQRLRVAGTPSQWLSRSLPLLGHSFSPSRAPPVV